MRQIGVLLVLALMIVPALASATPDQSYVLWPTGAPSNVWLGTPDNVNLSANLLTNDMATSYIWPNYATWSAQVLTFGNLPDTGTDQFTITLWAVISDLNPVNNIQVTLQDTQGAGWVVSYLSTDANWINYTWSYNQCPWTRAPWTWTEINNLAVSITAVLYGTTVLTQIGILVESVAQVAVVDMTEAIISTVAVMVIGFGLMAYAKLEESPVYQVFSGLVWVFGSVAVFYIYDVGWTVISLGLGMILLADGGSRILVNQGVTKK